VKSSSIRPEFVEFVPERLDDGVLYISERYKTVSHKCCCGCGEEVITPLSPADWSLRVDGEHVSLHPSIGNWNFACRSHYWIRRNQVVWAGAMKEAEIARVQLRDRIDKQRHIAAINMAKDVTSRPTQDAGMPATELQIGFLNRAWLELTRWWR